ncbi:MAG TPA: A24 family peptidase [Vicinamibacterales bacterium]|nr:A24 family peptidase [Vicinamibacterales bacterium]
MLTPSEQVVVFSVVATGTASALVDLWTRRVPNPLTLGIAAFGVALAAGHQTGLTVQDALLGFGVGFLLMLPAYLIGATGGGDVKLFAAFGTLLGPGAIGYAFFYTLLAGGVIAAAVAFQRRSLRATVERTAVFVTTRGANVAEIEHHSNNNRFPYAPAIAVGVLAAALGL